MQGHTPRNKADRALGGVGSQNGKDSTLRIVGVAVETFPQGKWSSMIVESSRDGLVTRID
jgi:hypothetical protein